MAKLDVIVLAAGSGTRLHSKLGLAKQFALLAGKPVWQHAIDSFLGHESVGHIILVLPIGSAAPEHLAKNIEWIEGGITRQASVHRGLQHLAGLPDLAGFVAIHDSARPFVPRQTIDALIEALDKGAEAVIPALPVVDTIKQISGKQISGKQISGKQISTKPPASTPPAYETHDNVIVLGTIARDTLMAAQTPQGFVRDMITKLHEDLVDTHHPASDDASLAEMAGIVVSTIAGDAALHKLTTPEDFEMAERRLNPNLNKVTEFETRIGNGFDVHKFGTGKGPIALCGLQVAHDRSIEAHSDGDVGLHALCDAIFGALGDGDIGQHFPPSDDKWKDAASVQFLEFAAKRVADRGGRIINLDVTIICEQPKIAPLSAQMRAEIAKITGISLARVSVKATTSEGLGFAGRGEGIAALASASLSLPIGALLVEVTNT